MPDDHEQHRSEILQFLAKQKRRRQELILKHVSEDGEVSEEGEEALLALESQSDAEFRRLTAKVLPPPLAEVWFEDGAEDPAAIQLKMDVERLRDSVGDLGWAVLELDPDIRARVAEINSLLNDSMSERYRMLRQRAQADLTDNPEMSEGALSAEYEARRERARVLRAELDESRRYLLARSAWKVAYELQHAIFGRCLDDYDERQGPADLRSALENSLVHLGQVRDALWQISPWQPEEEDYPEFAPGTPLREIDARKKHPPHLLRRLTRDLEELRQTLDEGESPANSGPT